MTIVSRGGAGGASSIIDLVDHEFMDREARDTFYAIQENRESLVIGETVILVLDNGSSEAVVEIWTGTTSPPTYENTGWADITSTVPSASVIKTLYESNANTEALVTEKLAILNTLTLSLNILRSVNPISIGDTIYWGDPVTDLTMRARRDATNGHLIYERRESSVWNEKFRVSDSLTVDTAHFTISDGPITVPSGDLCLYNLQIRDDEGNQILRPLFTDGINTFPAIASLPDGNVRVIQNLSAILANPTTVDAEYRLLAFRDEITSATTSTGATDAPAIAPLATNQQLVNQAVDSAVATLQNTIFNSGRSFIRFNDGFTIDDSNLATYEDKNLIYTAKNDKGEGSATRPDVNLPTDADIAAAGETYPVTFEFTHLGGTARSTMTNIVRFFFDGTEIGRILRDDAAVVVKEGVGQDYVITTGNFDPNDTILPTGVFNLKVDTPISNIATIATELTGVSIIAGDAYLVEIGGTWSGLTIPNNSILVAVVSSPSLVDSAANNDWLLLDNPRVNAKSSAFLANFVQDGIGFNGTRNIQIDPANVFEFTSIASGTPEVRQIGTNAQGSGRSIVYTNVPIQFTDLVGGRLAINLNFSVTSLSGFAPAFTTVRLEYPGGIIFDFPVNGTPINGNFMATIDTPNVDYSSALNQNCTLTLFFDFFGASFFGEYTVLNVVNTAVGRLHEAISSLIVSESMPLEARLQAQIDGITGELGEDEASFEAIQDRISPYRNNVSLSPDINVRYLDSTGDDDFPDVSEMTAVNPLNTQYTMGDTAVFIAVATGVEQAVVNGGTRTLLTSANANTDPNLELGESSTFEGRTYFVYRLSDQSVNDVIQTFELTFVQVVAWQDDINTLDSDINRIDAELEHAAINLSDDLIDVLDNSVTITEESDPTILPTSYNKSFSTNDTQTVFYETNPKTPSSGTRDSDVISASSSKIVVIPKDHVFSDGVILQANTGATTTDLVNFVGGQLVANVFVPAIPSGSKTVTVHPLPATQVQRDWYSIPLHTPSLQAEADELFFTRDVPISPTTLAFQYRYDANGGHGATQTINLVISDIAVDASSSATLLLPDGESVNVGFDWQSSQRRIRVTGTPFASDPNFFIFDMEVGVTFTETRTTPSVPATTRPVVLGLQQATGQDAVIATKVSSDGDLIIVGDVAEVNTNYTMAELFGAGLIGNLIVFTELGTYLNYTQFSPSAQTMVSLENHATLPQFGLFTTEYTHDTVVNLDTQLTVKDDKDNLINVGKELVMEDSNGDKFRVSINNGGTDLVFTAV